ncbi:MAG: MoaD/ThiS family protein [Deltaproteobacteria bacterium]|nr:MoaD/ThiS family protein [Deltaproteobacteria bacterium]
MVVWVQFFGIQRALIQANEVEVPLHGQGRVGDVFSYIRNCYPDLQLCEEDLLITVNNRVSDMEQGLNPDDKLAFLPHIGGG